ncbi:hypothetical protein RND81_05G107400 [Saponaria officinalis]|uniref:Uncharacterized protein n=1 Tax=Saponaria officinalis TaxID=3572 RepID=A0AAW1KS45_SAPOF
MMSLFSSFDALCAESTGWKSFNFSTAAAAPAAPSTAAREEHASTTECNKQVQNKVNEEKKAVKKVITRNPRFALEFDGLHCFETILPY